MHNDDMREELQQVLDLPRYRRACIPPALMIFGVKWRVYVVDGLSETMNADGMCFGNSHKIFIDVNQSTEMLKDTLLHEVLHAMFHVTGYTHSMEDEEEEELVELLTHGMTGLLQENQKWTKTWVRK